MKKSRLLQAALAVLALPAMLGAAASAPRGSELKYNEIVTIISKSPKSVGKEILWTHPGNRHNDKSKGFELLFGVGSAQDKRTVNGCQFLMIQNANDPKKTGPVSYDEEVAILSLSTRGGIGSFENNVWPLGKRWYCAGDSRHSENEPGRHGEILIHDANVAPANVGKFKLKHIDNLQGHVYQNDVLRIIYSAAGLFLDKDAWIHNDSRYGSGYHELLIGEAKDLKRNIEQGKFQIQAVDFDKLTDATAKQVWLDLKNAGVGMTVEAKDAGALSALSAGTRVSLFVPKYDKYLQAQADGKLKATGAASTDPACQFTVLREGNWVGFQSATAGGQNLGAVPNSHLTQFKGKNFAGFPPGALVWEQWALEFEDPNSLRGVHLRNKASFGLLATPNPTSADWTGGFASTAENKVGNTFVVADTTGDMTRINIDVFSNPPTGYSAEVGWADFIASGSDGKGEALIITSRGDKLFKYSPYTMAPDPWVAMDASDATGPLGVIGGLTVSSDGVVCVLVKDGKPFKLDVATNKFVPMPLGAGNEALKFNNISAGNAESIWGITTTKDLVKFEAAGITIVAKGIALNVAAGVDGFVVATNEAGGVFKYLGPDKFQALGAGISAEDVAVGNEANIYAIDDGVTYQFANNAWTALKGTDGNNAAGFKAVAASAAGTVCLLDAGDEFFHNAIKGFSVPVLPAPAAPGMPAAAVGTVVVATAETRDVAAAVGKINIAEDKKSDKQKRVVAEKAKTTKLQTFNKQLKDVQKKLKKATGAAKATLQKQEKDLKAKIKTLQKKAKKKPTAKAKKAGKKKAGKKVAGKKAAGKKAAGKKAAGKKAAGKKAAGKKAVGKKAAGKKAAGKKAAGKKAAAKQ